MSMETTRPQMIARRGELMAELFLQELGTAYIAKSSAPDFPFDFFIGFRTDQGGLNTYAVEVKATEQPVEGRYALQRPMVDYLTKSNIPVLLLVVDVKRNRLYYTLGNAIAKAPRSNGKQLTLRVPVIEIDDTVKAALRSDLASNGSKLAVL